MKRKINLIILSLCCCVFIENVTAQTGTSPSQNIYVASTIPQELKKDAHSVKRKDDFVIEITQPGKATYKIHTIETILDSKGLHNLFFTMYMNSFRVLDDVELKLYDSVGKIISKHKRKDLSTTIDGEGLVPDYKVLYADLSNVRLPVTLETKLEITMKGIWQIPSYFPQSPNESVEQSNFTVRFVPEIGINYKPYNTDIKAEKTTVDKFTSFTFNAKMLKAWKYEDNSGPWKNYFPHILFNAEKFEYGGFEGNMASWKEFGLWFTRASKNLNQLFRS